MKHTKRFIVRLLVLTITVTLCLALFSPVASASGLRRTVRIPCNFSDLLRLDKDGQPTGQGAQYLEVLARVNNWTYEYVPCTSSEAYELLEDGKIDILFPVLDLPEYHNSMDFSALPGGYYVSGMYARSDSKVSYNAFSDYNGSRIGVPRDSSLELALKSFAAKNGFSYTPVYIETLHDRQLALQNNAVDFIVCDTVNDISNAIITSVVSLDPFYYTVRHGSFKLMRELDAGMQRIFIAYPDIASGMSRSSVSGSNVAMLALTEPEREFIRSGTPVRVGFYEQNIPLSYLDDNGEPTGIYIDLLKTLSELTGLNIVPVPIRHGLDFKDILKNGDVDFVIGTSDVTVTNSKDFRLTNSFMTYSNILVHKPDTVFGNLSSPTVAFTPSRANWADFLRDRVDRHIRVRIYLTTKECLDAVINGEVDASVVNNMEFNYHSKNVLLSSLVISQRHRYTTDLTLAALADVDPAMFSTLNKALPLLTNELVDSVTNKYMKMPYTSYTLIDRLEMIRHPLTVISIIVIGVTAILLTVTIIRRRQQRIIDEMRETERRQLQTLSALSSDYTIVYHVDLDEDRSEVVNYSKILRQYYNTNAPTSHRYSEAVREYTNTYIIPEDRERVLPLANTKTLMRHFGDTDQFSVRYRIIPDSRNQTFFEMNFVRVENSDAGHHMMVLGVRCVDDIVRDEQAQKQLLQDALDGANRANAAKSEFLSRMSHDIRTPMNAIIGMTAIASAHSDDPDRVHDALTKINGASRHLLSLINDILDMSKIESGKLSLDDEDIDMSELISNLLDIIQPQVAQHKHDLQVNIFDIRHEKVIGDSLRIQQVLVNLMSNAVKYTPDGGQISLTLREKPVSTNSAACFEFTLKDNGIGMTKEFTRHIFEPFSRAEDSKVNKIQGTGLGMSITHNIVQMMNGSIDVESEPGKGSTFIVTIFLKIQKQSDIELVDFSGLSVYLVDDNEDVLESVGEILSELGVNARTFTSGEACVEAVKQAHDNAQRIDAILLDWRMPGMSGVDTASAIHAFAGNSIPIAILSAYDWSTIADAARAVGVTHFVAKPVFKSAIIRLFKSILNNEAPPEDADIGLDQFKNSSYAGRCILLAEDNPLNREIACEILKMTGLTVEEAENGQIAMDKFVSNEPGHYDMILMDIQMPVMGGYDATRAIRSLTRPDAATIPIVAMTANAFAEDVRACKAAGMNDHLSKPIDFDRLAAVLNKYLSPDK